MKTSVEGRWAGCGEPVLTGDIDPPAATLVPALPGDLARRVLDDTRKRPSWRKARARATRCPCPMMLGTSGEEARQRCGATAAPSRRAAAKPKLPW